MRSNFWWAVALCAGSLQCTAVAGDDGCGDDDGEEGGGLSTVNVISVAALLCLSGLFSGLNLGLMSFAEDDLMVIIRGSQDAQEVKDAKTILPLRKRGNLLLCTLLLGNTLVNALLAILLAGMTSGLIGSIATTVLIVIFGEIGPQALCSRYALAIGAKAVPIVWVFMVICFVFAYPISLVLDKLLGGEVSSVYTKNELVSLIQLNVESDRHNQESGLTQQDKKLLVGAITFREKPLDVALTPLDAAFMLPGSAVLDLELIQELLSRGYTRIPVYDDTNGFGPIFSILYVKDLVGLGFERAMPLKDVLKCFDADKRVKRVPHTTTLGEAYEACLTARLHLLIVTGPEGAKLRTKKSLSAEQSGASRGQEPTLAGASGKACKAPKKGAGGASGEADIGIITLEDILEEIIQDEIVDENDELVDAAAASTRNTKVAQRNDRQYDPAKLVKQMSATADVA